VLAALSERAASAGDLPRAVHCARRRAAVDPFSEATSQELSALVPGVRMVLEGMRAAPEPPPKEAVEILERVLDDFDRAGARHSDGQKAGG
jgi:hypothetical protein